MKMIDLLNKIANGEEVPKKIKFCLRNFEFSKYKQDYFCRDNDEQGIYGMSICKWLFLPLLNDEVEILEEKPTQEEIKEYTNKFLEVWKPINKQFGKLFDELLRIKNDLELNLEDEIEEKKIPEKLEILNANEHSKEVYYENYSKEEISLDIETLQVWVNKIIDYLKSKGDE